MLRALFATSLFLQTYQSSVSFRSSVVPTSGVDFVLSPCGGQSIADIMKYKLICDGSTFVPPAHMAFGYYYYETGRVVDRPITSYKRFHFEHQVDPETKRSVLGPRHDFDIMIDPFDLPFDVIKSNGGICIPFGEKVDIDDS
jgi:hypothetical protein